MSAGCPSAIRSDHAFDVPSARPRDPDPRDARRFERSDLGAGGGVQAPGQDQPGAAGGKRARWAGLAEDDGGGAGEPGRSRQHQPGNAQPGAGQRLEVGVDQGVGGDDLAAGPLERPAQFGGIAAHGRQRQRRDGAARSKAEDADDVRRRAPGSPDLVRWASGGRACLPLEARRLPRFGPGPGRRGRRGPCRARSSTRGRSISAPIGPLMVESIFLKSHPRDSRSRVAGGDGADALRRLIGRQAAGLGVYGGDPPLVPRGSLVEEDAHRPAPREGSGGVARAGQVVGDKGARHVRRADSAPAPYHIPAGRELAPVGRGALYTTAMIRRWLIAALAVAAVVSARDATSADPVAALSLVRPKPPQVAKEFRVPDPGQGPDLPVRPQGQGRLPQFLGDLVQALRGGDAGHGAAAPALQGQGPRGAGDLRGRGRGQRGRPLSQEAQAHVPRRARSADDAGRPVRRVGGARPRSSSTGRASASSFANGVRDWAAPPRPTPSSSRSCGDREAG